MKEDKLPVFLPRLFEIYGAEPMAEHICSFGCLCLPGCVMIALLHCICKQNVSSRWVKVSEGAAHRSTQWCKKWTEVKSVQISWTLRRLHSHHPQQRESHRRVVSETCCLTEVGRSTANRKIQRQLLDLREISCSASLQHLINRKSSLLLCILQCQKHYHLIKLFHCFAISSNMSL